MATELSTTRTPAPGGGTIVTLDALCTFEPSAPIQNAGSIPANCQALTCRTNNQTQLASDTTVAVGVGTSADPTWLAMTEAILAANRKRSFVVERDPVRRFETRPILVQAVHPGTGVPQGKMTGGTIRVVTTYLEPVLEDLEDA